MGTFINYVACPEGGRGPLKVYDELHEGRGGLGLRHVVLFFKAVSKSPRNFHEIPRGNNEKCNYIIWYECERARTSRRANGRLTFPLSRAGSLVLTCWSRGHAFCLILRIDEIEIHEETMLLHNLDSEIDVGKYLPVIEDLSTWPISPFSQSFD